jgi:hypothetical protein
VDSSLFILLKLFYGRHLGRIKKQSAEKKWGRCRDSGLERSRLSAAGDSWRCAGLDEIGDRFGKESELRQVQMESLRWLVGLARRAGVMRIVVNGSFVADAYEPNDVDCALLIGPEYPRDSVADMELQLGLPFIQSELLTQVAFDYYVDTVFGTDRRGVPKGVIEVLL